MIRFACPSCRTPSEAAVDQAGAKIECPYCGQRLEIPRPPREQTLMGILLPAEDEADGRNRPAFDSFAAAIRGQLPPRTQALAAKPSASPSATPTTDNSTRPAAPAPVAVLRRATQLTQGASKKSPLRLGFFVAAMCAAVALILWGAWPSDARRQATAPTTHGKSTPPAVDAEARARTLDALEKILAAMEEDPPIQPLPLNGTVERFHLGEPVAPLRVVTRDQGQHYFVKVCNWTKGELIATLFVRAGSTAEANMPLGLFQLRYATGTTWYGPEHCFGPQTTYHKADLRFNFHQVGREVRGFTVELFLRPNGNLRTNSIRREDF